MAWREAFKECVGHRAQVLALRRYVQGLLSDSTRKSMEAMLSRVTAPGAYQAFQHFITDSPWDAACVWRRLRAVLPERDGWLIFDETSFPKQGTHSVGVARQYCGHAGQDRQLSAGGDRGAVDRGSGVSARGRALLACRVADRGGAAAGRVPAGVAFQEKWRQALTLLRQVRASGVHVRGVLADAEFGDNKRVSNDLAPVAAAVCGGDFVAVDSVPRHTAAASAGPQPAGPTTDAAPPARGRTPAQRGGDRRHAGSLATRQLAQPPRGRRWTVQCVALRVTPAQDWRQQHRLAPEVWLLCERDGGATPRTKYYLVNLPASATLKAIVRVAHHRWAIEQQYQELKTELGLDHFEGRTLPGWHHHVVLTAITYNFLQTARRRPRVPLTFPVVRAFVQELFTAYLFAQRPQYLKRIEALRTVKLQI